MSVFSKHVAALGFVLLVEEFIKTWCGMTNFDHVLSRISAGDKISFRQDFYGRQFVSTRRRLWSWLRILPRTWIAATPHEIDQIKAALDRRRRSSRRPVFSAQFGNSFTK